MKNHKIGPEFDSFMNEFLPYLYTNKAIYYVPAGKVMPTKFFLGWSWVASGQIENQINNFRPAKKYEEIMRWKIKKALQKCPVIITNKKA